MSTTCPFCLIFFHFFVWERKQIRAMRNSGQLHQVAPPAPLHCPEPISINISDPGFGGSYTILGLSVVCSLNIYDKCIAYSQSCSYTFNPNKSLFRQKKSSSHETLHIWGHINNFLTVFPTKCKIRFVNGYVESNFQVDGLLNRFCLSSCDFCCFVGWVVRSIWIQLTTPRSEHGCAKVRQFE